ncbi:MAG: SUMF1/EgtB/PvdO family nonheme iron enzyme [Luteolibacter sp.]|uniref:SUMF1/EgtB/PvdO family nonheme iron enzyme n=1 Tax=Luteolibacter sp. TaxID=1962973 RepID=UPI003262D6AC
MDDPSKELRVFVSYSHKDADLKGQFDTNLRVMERQGIIQKWTDGEIQPGDRWAESITEAMNNSQIIIFMVSNNFLDSDFIRNTEAPLAMQRMNEGKAVVVPVLLRNTPGWKHEKWYSLQALPSEVKPVEHDFWRNSEEAFADVEKRLREMVELLPAKLTQQEKAYHNRVAGRTEATGQDISPPEKSDIESPPAPPGIHTSFPSFDDERGKGKTGKVWPKLGIALIAIVAVVGGIFLFSPLTGTGSGTNEKEAAIHPLQHDSRTPLENSLGMKFVNIPGTDILCSIWEIRVADFREFTAEDHFEPQDKMFTFELDPADQQWKWGNYGKNWKNPGFYQSETHPVVGISLATAKRFCDWLTRRERLAKKIPRDWEYRIMRDAEWSLAAGDSLYPWNPYQVDLNKRGNYMRMALNMDSGKEYNDGYPNTAPVGSYPPNHLGIHDLGGNVQEVMDTPYDKALNTPYLLKKYPQIDADATASACCRGGGWDTLVVPGSDFDIALSQMRWRASANDGGPGFGFRAVLSPVGYSVNDKHGDGRTPIEIPESSRSFVLSNQSDAGSSFFYKLPVAPLKEFDATIQYRVSANYEKAGFGMAFIFRKGANAPGGFRAYVNYLKQPSWGSGYHDAKNIFQGNPWETIDKGMIAVDGTPNRLRAVVRGNTVKIYSNDCMVGETEFDAVPLAGDLTVAAQLVPFGTVWDKPNEVPESGLHFVGIEIETIEYSK